MIYKNDPNVSPFEQYYNVRRLVGSLYWNLSLRSWFRIFWKHPEADVFWYSIGPFVLLITPK